VDSRCLSSVWVSSSSSSEMAFEETEGGEGRRDEMRSKSDGESSYVES
jgi:hypothetical protein